MRVAWLALALATGIAGLPPSAERALNRDWCRPSTYAQLRKLPHLGKLARRNLFESQRLVRQHPVGCRIAESAASRPGKRFYLAQHPSWTHHTRRGECATGPLPLGPGASRAAARVAAQAIGRGMRPVVVGYDRHRRVTQLTYQCGSKQRARTVVVLLRNTALLPEASASQTVLAVSHFRRYGWRVWLVIH